MEDYIREALKHPFYINKKKEEKIITTKKELTENVTSLLSKPELLKSVYWSLTSNLTRIPVDVKENDNHRRAFSNFLKKKKIIHSDMIVLNTFSGGKSIRSMELFQAIFENAEITSLALGSALKNEDIFFSFETFKANTIAGFPLRILSFSQWVNSQKKKIKLKYCLYGGGPLNDSTKKYLKKILGIEFFIGIYGSSELGAVAYSTDGTTYHYDPSLIHMEITENKLFLTNLMRKRFPLINYETLDNGKWVKEGEFNLDGKNKEFTIKLNEYYFADFEKLLGDELIEYQFVYDKKYLNGDDILLVHINCANLKVSEEVKKKVEKFFEKDGFKEIRLKHIDLESFFYCKTTVKIMKLVPNVQECVTAEYVFLYNS